jgi:peptidyl-tRNA hydrolase, PTH1 family
MKYLLVGLGNIGPEYAMTRHNIGFMALDRLLSSYSKTWDLGRHAYHAELKHKGKTLILIKPTTYMNLSGKAVRHWMGEHKIPKENILVLSDDIALPFGKIRIKPKGSHGGHNGLRNIEELLGDANFARLRVGVGSDFGKGQQAEYVLANFPESEIVQLPEILDKIGDACLEFCAAGLNNAMNNFNQ